MSIHSDLDEHCPACGKKDLAMAVTSIGVSVHCLCGQFGMGMSQQAESAQSKVLGMLRGELPRDGTQPKQLIARGRDPFVVGAQFISFNSSDDFVTIQIDSRQSKPEFQDTIDRINELIEKAVREREQ